MFGPVLVLAGSHKIDTKLIRDTGRKIKLSFYVISLVISVDSRGAP